MNGQDAYSGQLVPIRVWAGSAQQDEVAAPLLAEGTKRGLRTSDIDGASWVIEQVGEPDQVTTSAGKQLGDVAQTLLRYYGQGSDLDTQSWVVQDKQVGDA